MSTFVTHHLEFWGIRKVLVRSCIVALVYAETCVTFIYTCVRQELPRVLYPEEGNLGQRTIAAISQVRQPDH